VRKAKLLSTVAAALLLSVGAASAQGMSKDAPERAPAAQQNAPAEKVAPSLKGGEQKAHEQKAPQTTGQAAPETKSGKPHETTGQAPKSDADKTGRTMDKDSSSGAAATDKSDMHSGTNVRSKTEQNAQSPNGASPKSSQTTEQNRMTTGQGAAAGSAKLTTEQRTKITTIIRQQKVEPVRLNVAVSVGTRIPASVHVYPLPVEVIAVYPEWRGYDYILVGAEIVIINPRTHEIVAVVEA
jgi:hypothetical protein